MEPPLSVVLRFGFRAISGVAEFFRPSNLRKGKKLVNVNMPFDITDDPLTDDGLEVDKPHCITVPERDFVHLSDGSFHLAKGVVITASQAAKVLKNKKAAIDCKDTAQAIWGTELLSERSVYGVAAPKARATGQLPKQLLTPTKADVVTATVRHWGTIKGEDVSAAIANITKVLSEKIQDARKSTKRLAAMSKTNK
ncbi:hypothetical protein HPB52_004383 [Rhipicephalus sanguineus]|uniref:BEN domain-containing protein n=1 Tax=Rhipicephalus sanguineus TaxID=34632 RepID=A0A9D4Q9U2_RHISA|nr:hypothetical protein HPB52_004383 [Rhipicephalus sanguineus]